MRKGKALGRKLSKQTRFAVTLQRTATRLDTLAANLELEESWRASSVERDLKEMASLIRDVLGPGDRWPAVASAQVVVEFTKGSCPVCAKRARRAAKADILHPRARRRIEL